MKETRYVIISLVLGLMLLGCGSNEKEKIPEQEPDKMVLKSEYDSLASELEQLKTENINLESKLREYEEYSDIIEAMNSEDYGGAIKAVWKRVPRLENEIVSNSINVTEEDLIGLWVSSKDQNCFFELKENGDASISDMECTWSMNKDSYGPTGVTIQVDDGAGWYSLIFFGNDPIILLGNGHTTNIPNYLNLDSFSGSFFKQ